MENKITSEQEEQIKEISSNSEFKKAWSRLHTPWIREPKVGRNEICPFCNSGKKFKKCCIGMNVIHDKLSALNLFENKCKYKL